MVVVADNDSVQITVEVCTEAINEMSQLGKMAPWFAFGKRWNLLCGYIDHILFLARQNV